MKNKSDDALSDQQAVTPHDAAPTPEAIQAQVAVLSDSASVLLERARLIQKPLAAPPPMLNLQSQTGFNHSDEYHIDDLLQYHGRHFVECAHLALLKRAAGVPELDRFTDELRSGRSSKIDILETLHASAEGRAAQVGLSGLPSLGAKRLARLPLVGHLLRVLKGVWRLPILMDNQRRFEAYALARQQDLADQINRLAEQKGEQLYIIVEDMAETLVMLAEELHKVSAQLAAAREKQISAPENFNQRRETPARQLED